MIDAYHSLQCILVNIVIIIKILSNWVTQPNVIVFKKIA